MRELAVEIAEILGSSHAADIDAVEVWLLETDADDGSDVEILADRFDMERGLPSSR